MQVLSTEMTPTGKNIYNIFAFTDKNNELVYKIYFIIYDKYPNKIWNYCK